MNSRSLTYIIGHKIKKLRGKITDDFDWKIYNSHYRGELKEIVKSHTLVIRNGDFIFQDNRLLKKNDTLLDLHPNHNLLYETILQLKPNSIFELGCGGGDHLHNLSILSKNAKLYGFDLSNEQLAYLKERHPDLTAELKQYDCTLPFPHNQFKVDIAYTQAVIMHIQTGNAHMVALSNLFNTASKQVVLMEHWGRHNFLADIEKLFSMKIIPWDEIFFYYREIEESKTPHLMIVSSVPLNQYKILSDYKILCGNV